MNALNIQVLRELKGVLTELKLANESSAPAYIKQEISSDIASQQFIVAFIAKTLL